MKGHHPRWVGGLVGHSVSTVLLTLVCFNGACSDGCQLPFRIKGGLNCWLSCIVGYFILGLDGFKGLVVMVVNYPSELKGGLSYG